MGTRVIPQAESIEWMGLCPCGCGTYKAVLIDEGGTRLASFGFDREGWVKFTSGIIKQIDGEPPDGAIYHDHTAH